MDHASKTDICDHLCLTNNWIIAEAILFADIFLFDVQCICIWWVKTPTSRCKGAVDASRVSGYAYPFG